MWQVSAALKWTDGTCQAKGPQNNEPVISVVQWNTSRKIVPRKIPLRRRNHECQKWHGKHKLLRMMRMRQRLLMENNGTGVHIVVLANCHMEQLITRILKLWKRMLHNQLPHLPKYKHCPWWHHPLCCTVVQHLSWPTSNDCLGGFVWCCWILYPFFTWYGYLTDHLLILCGRRNHITNVTDLGISDMFLYAFFQVTCVVFHLSWWGPKPWTGCWVVLAKHIHHWLLHCTATIVFLALHALAISLTNQDELNGTNALFLWMSPHWISQNNLILLHSSSSLLLPPYSSLLICWIVTVMNRGRGRTTHNPSAWIGPAFSDHPFLPCHHWLWCNNNHHSLCQWFCYVYQN